MCVYGCMSKIEWESCWICCILTKIRDALSKNWWIFPKLMAIKLLEDYEVPVLMLWK